MFQMQPDGVSVGVVDENDGAGALCSVYATPSHNGGDDIFNRPVYPFGNGNRMIRVTTVGCYGRCITRRLFSHVWIEPRVGVVNIRQGYLPLFFIEMQFVGATNVEADVGVGEKLEMTGVEG